MYSMVDLVPSTLTTLWSMLILSAVVLKTQW